MNEKNVAGNHRRLDPPETGRAINSGSHSSTPTSGLCKMDESNTQRWATDGLEFPDFSISQEEFVDQVSLDRPLPIFHKDEQVRERNTAQDISGLSICSPRHTELDHGVQTPSKNQNNASGAANYHILLTTTQRLPNFKNQTRDDPATVLQHNSVRLTDGRAADSPFQVSYLPDFKDQTRDVVRNRQTRPKQSQANEDGSPNRDGDDIADRPLPSFKDQVNYRPDELPRAHKHRRHDPTTQRDDEPARDLVAEASFVEDVYEEVDENVDEQQTKAPWYHKAIICLNLVIIVSAAAVGGACGAGLCSGRNNNDGVSLPSRNSDGNLIFQSTAELYRAFDLYMDDKSLTSEYGDSIKDWDVSKIKVFDRLFDPNRNFASLCESHIGPCRTSNFNEDLSHWNTSSATSMVGMFMHNILFNGDITTWDVSHVTNMESLFESCLSFNQDISRWDVSAATNLREVFDNATSFNQNIGNWDVSSAIETTFMFYYAAAFNNDITQWKVSSVTSMVQMFRNATSFNQDISGWSLSSAVSLTGMFESASSFNQDISGWDVERVAYLDWMFFQAFSFSQNLCPWLSKLSSSAHVEGMFRFATSCPKTDDPVLPSGPMCHVCV